MDMRIENHESWASKNDIIIMCLFQDAKTERAPIKEVMEDIRQNYVSHKDR